MIKQRGSNHGGRGGRRLGAGRKRGYKAPSTLKREDARRLLAERVLAEIDELASAQISLAKGLQVMFGRLKGEWVRVTDPDLMLKCLRSGEPFYRITSNEPDGRALKDIFDREFGRPTETTRHEGVSGGAIKIVHVHRPAKG